MAETLQRATLVVVVACVVMFTNLGGPRLWDRDEPRNAQCAAEMQARGDWVTPVMNAELRTHKPVLQYWFMMSAYRVFGVNEFAARFWSAAMAVGTALCTFLIGRRLFDERVGMWAGIIVSSVLMFDVAGRAATPDSPLIFFSTLAITLFVLGSAWAHTPESNSQSTPETLSRSDASQLFPSWSWAVAVYAVMGIAMLAKGPVGLVLPTAVIGMFMLIMRLPRVDQELTQHGWWHTVKRAVSCFGPLHFLRTCWAMRPVTAIIVSLTVALPWYIWVGVRTDGEFLRGFFLDHNLSRATQSMEGHGGNVLFYPLTILIGFFPWSVFAIPVALDAVRHARQTSKWFKGYVFAACWVGVYVVLFSIAKTKLPSYITPCYPALALLTGCFVERWTRDSVAVSRLWFRPALCIAAIVGLGFLIGVPIAAALFLPGDGWLGLVGLLPLVGGIAALLLNERQQSARAARVFACAAVAFTTLLFGVVADRVDSHQEFDEFLTTVARRGDDTRVASYGILEPSWVFYSQQSIDELSMRGIRQPSPTWVQRDGVWVAKPAIFVDDVLQRNAEHLIITSDKHLDTLSDELPGGFEVLAEVPYFLKEGKLVLVAPNRASTSLEVVADAESDDDIQVR